MSRRLVGMDFVELAGGTRLPMLGVGMYKVDDAEVPRVVDAALEAGFTAFDTATMYGNEAAIGRALAQAGATDAVVTTKVVNHEQGHRSTLDAFERSRDALQRDVIDLYLIHWPAPTQDKFVETWEAITNLQTKHLIRSIGVSNFHLHHLDRLTEAGLPTPAINQVERHPWLPQTELIEAEGARGIVTQAWSPLARGRVLDEPVLGEIARNHGVDPAQVVLAWQRQTGVPTVVKSVHPQRLRENIKSLDVTLSADDIAQIATIANGTRTGADPDDRD